MRVQRAAKTIRTAVLTIATLGAVACGSVNQVDPKLAGVMPNKIVWAWERPEDLTFLDPKEFGVAFLAQTILLEEQRVIPNRRRQPLDVPPGAYLVAVTRIETNKETSRRPRMGVEMVQRLTALIRSTLELPGVRGIQIDFDAVSSERAFYRDLINEVRKNLPEGATLTMTSLASWCIGDAWFNDFPVDEAVPMAFRMGADETTVRSFLRNGNDWNEPLCRGSYGVSVDDPALEGLRPGRRMYYFADRPWTRADLGRLPG